MGVRWLFLIAVLGLTIFESQFFVRRWKEHAKNAYAKESLKKLSSLTLQYYRAKEPPLDSSFWINLGRKDPILDPWGVEYRLEAKIEEGVKKEFFWRSAGFDRVFQTSDDLALRVPYGEQGNPDFTGQHWEEQGLPAVEVK